MQNMSAATPAEAWKKLREGNLRFVEGNFTQPRPTPEQRAALAAGQSPSSVLFGCADSRVAAELIFDQGLGDMFVVRTAGHLIDTAVLGSIEFGVEELGCSLIAILGHDSCGAVKATIDAVDSGEVPGGFIRDIVERMTPSVLTARRLGYKHPDEIGADHVLETAKLLLSRSTIIEAAVREGRAAIVGLTYNLVDGRAIVRKVIGDIGDPDVVEAIEIQTD